MTTQFSNLLKKLIGKDITVVTYENERHVGIVELSEDGLLLLSSMSTTMSCAKSYVIREKHIQSIAFDRSDFKVRKNKSKGTDPLWKWLKGVEDKEVKLLNSNDSERGTVISVDKDLCFIETSRNVVAMGIKDIKEVSGDSGIFNVKSVVSFEEIING